MRLIYRLLFKLFGWKITGQIPGEQPKYIVIVAPHTSNWDFFIGLAVRSICRMDTRYLAKKELFGPPFGWIFRKLGGYPVDRSRRNNFVDAVVDLFDEHERFSIAITPEGTRKYVPKWKTGFYYIALKAKVPLVMAGLDYGEKTVEFLPPFHPTGDIESDLEKILEFFRGKKGKYPEKGVR